MNNQQIIEIVRQIEQLATTQADLVANDNASTKHTELVFREIAERCAGVQPNNLLDLKAVFNEELFDFLEGAIGFCEATREEQCGIWWRFIHDKPNPPEWREGIGFALTIGYIDDRPIHLVLLPVQFNGHKIIFYEATSQVVDHVMIDTFIETVAPDSARSISGIINRADAANFINLIPKREKAE